MNTESDPDDIRTEMPDRPLSVDEEVRELHETTDRLNVEPMESFSSGGPKFAYVIRIVNRHTETVFQYGFSPEAGEWIQIGRWSRSEVTHENQADTAEEWGDRFFDEFQEVGYL